jgi:hypothetical protein
LGEIVVRLLRIEVDRCRVGNITGRVAMDYIAALAREKEQATKAATDGGLSASAFRVY